MPVQRFRVRPSILAASALALSIGAALAPPSAAQINNIRRMLPAGNAAAPVGGVVSLPYSVGDNQGNQWMVHQYGQLQQQGNQPVYSQGAMLQINGNHPQTTGNRGRLDPKTNELLLENMNVANVPGLTLTRRILFDREEGSVRYIDILRNNGNQEVTPQLTLTTNLNYGVQSATNVQDPKKRESNIGWVATTHANGRVVAEMYAGKGAKVVPAINYQQGNSQVQVMLAPAVPPGKEVAFMHFHLTVPSTDAGQKFIQGMKESKVMATLPPQLRKIIINYRGGENFIGDYELLRGESLDVVELRSGDQLRGTLKQAGYKLQTFYGTIEVPVDKVIGLINIGEFRPRQLVVTRDGEVFGGYLKEQKLPLELSSGQVTEIPIGQVSRMGYRKRPGEPEEWAFNSPMVLMRTGDRIGIRLPPGDIEAATRYGRLKLRPASVAAVNFQSEEHGVHEIFLTDGSKFAGLIVAEGFEMKLAGEGPEQVVKFPASSIRRLQLAPLPEDSAAGSDPVLKLANEDQLVGALSGKLNLDTAFSTLALEAAQIKKMVHTPGSPTDVQVVLWDDTTVSGQLQEQEITCQLKSGSAMKVPVALVEEYNQPRPQASAAAVEGVRQLVAQLSATDAQQREFAEERLAAMGMSVVEMLRQMRATATPESQPRFDAVLKRIDPSLVPEVPKPQTGPAPQPAVGVPQPQ